MVRDADKVLIGNIANAIIAGLAKGPFKNVTVWTEVLQDAFLDFFDQEQLLFASATSLRLTPGMQRFGLTFSDCGERSWL